MMLFGTPLEAHSSACAPLMYTTGNAGSVSLICAATSQPFNRTFQANVSDKSLVVFLPAPKQGQGFLARREDVGSKAAIGQRVLDHALNWIFIFDDKDQRQLVHVINTCESSMLKRRS